MNSKQTHFEIHTLVSRRRIMELLCFHVALAYLLYN